MPKRERIASRARRSSTSLAVMRPRKGASNVRNAATPSSVLRTARSAMRYGIRGCCRARLHVQIPIVLVIIDVRFEHELKIARDPPERCQERIALVLPQRLFDLFGAGAASHQVTQQLAPCAHVGPIFSGRA